MYPLILVELIVLISYGYLKRQQQKEFDDNEDTLNSYNGDEDDDDDDTVMNKIIGEESNAPLITSGDIVTIIPTQCPVQLKTKHGVSQIYWAPGPVATMGRPEGPVIKTQSAPTVEKRKV